MAKAPSVRVPHDKLRNIVRDIFAAAGTTAPDAATVADALVWANLRGVDTHGVSRVPRYLELFESGEARAAAQMKVSHPRPGVVLIDADSAPGPVALSCAMNEAVAAARQTGIAWAGVRGTVHTGAIGYYTSLAAAQGMIGIGLVAGIPNMAYHGARGVGLATSPLSIAIPTGNHPTFVLDMATALMALARFQQYRAQNRPLPEGAGMTKDGEPTTDPALAAIPLPLGGAKGAGMSLAFELLTGGLMNNPVVPSYHKKTPGGRRHRQNASMIAVDVSAFLGVNEFRGIVDETIATVKGLPPIKDGEEILFAGERGARTYAARLKDGIPLSADAMDSLAKAAEKYHLPAFSA